MQSIVPILRKNGKPPVPAGALCRGPELRPAGGGASREGRRPPRPLGSPADGSLHPCGTSRPAAGRRLAGLAASSAGAAAIRSSTRMFSTPYSRMRIIRSLRERLVSTASLFSFCSNSSEMRSEMRRLPSSPRRLMVRGFASLMSSIVSHSVSLRNNCSLPNPGKAYNIKLS